MEGQVGYSIPVDSTELGEEGTYTNDVSQKRKFGIFGYNNYLMSLTKKISNNALEMDLYLLGIKQNIKANMKVIHSDLAGKLRLEKDYINFNSVKDLVENKHGITISLNEVFIDRGELIILSKLSSDKEICEDKRFSIIDASIYINDIKIKTEEDQCSHKLDKHFAEEERRYCLEELDFCGQANIKVVFSNVMVNNKIKWGPWIFKTKVYC